jgi:sec-independent protein translocase protein TatB
MFDIGFSEIIVCAVVGLVVIGPERLPETVRTVGLWVGRFKRSMRETREEIERQVGMDDVKRQLHTEEMMRTLENMQEEIDSALNYERMGNKKPAIEHEPVTSTAPAALEQQTSAALEQIPAKFENIIESEALSVELEQPIIIQTTEKIEPAVVRH